MLAFSIWNALWVVFASFLLVSVLMILFSVLVDLFRDKELSGGAKAVWVIVLLLLPLVGLLIYMIARGDGMAQRAMAEQQANQESFDSYVRDVAGGSAASELEKAAAMHASGAISDDEYATLKSKILS